MATRPPASAAAPGRAREDIPRLRLVRTYPVGPEKVWQAWTDPQALSRWFGPGDTRGVERAELDLRPGGRWHIRFLTQDGQDHDVGGVIQEVTLHGRLSMTWAWKSTPERVSLVTIELRPVRGGTELVFTHERFFDRAAAEGHTRGWTAAFARLDALLGS